jgi:D-aminoacyl-tRNA deacylase
MASLEKKQYLLLPPKSITEGISIILLVASNKDIASLNIARQVLNHYPFEKQVEIFDENPVYEATFNDKKVKLVILKEESVYAQKITDYFTNLKLIVFISKHSSLSGTPTMSVHTPGNLSEAELGGLPRTVSISPANAMRDALMVMAHLKTQMKLDYKVSYECTHHGPSLSVPTMFAELGSSPEQWNDSRAAEAVAHAAMGAVSGFGKSEVKTVLGIGGLHYNEKFTRLVLEGDVAFGHVIPKYAIPHLDAEILEQCVEKTMERVESAVLDWKGIKGEHKPGLIELLRQLDMPFTKV